MSSAALADLQAVLDGVPALVSYLDTDLRIRFANRACGDYFGLARERIIGRPIRELLGEETFARNEALMRTALRGELQRFERSSVDASGQQRFVQATFVPDLRDGSVQGFFVHLSDVTALGLAQRALGEERAFLQAVLDNMPGAAMFVVDRTLRVERALGASTLASVGLTPDDYVGKTVLEFALAGNGAPLEAACREALAGGRARVEVERAGRRFEVNAVPLSEATGPRERCMVVSYDVTERDRLRTQLATQERLATMGTLAAGVGHEINNPLSYVTTSVELAAEVIRALARTAPAAQGGRYEEALALLADARDGAERIGKIVRGLRLFARQDAASAPTDVHAALDAAIGIATHELRFRAQLQREFGPVPRVMADDARLAQVFVNLLVNAAQAFAARPVENNHVFVTTRTDELGRAVIEVRDDGPGMDARTAARIFDAYFTTKPLGQGLGLGLSISHHIVTSLGGTIACDTAPGMGATFRVTLPAASAGVLLPAKAERQVAPSRRARVLVIDDDPRLTASVVRVLGDEHDVTPINDPRAARDRLQAETFDVVFCDVMMPHLSGVDLFRSIRERCPAQAERFIFITGGVVDPGTREFLDSLPNPRLDKPLGLQKLRDTVRAFVTPRG